MAERRLLYTVYNHFFTVSLFKEQELGQGSFATVCRAQCDDLPCAAKVLHSEFFDQENPDPGEGTFISKFVSECNILPSIAHPNIVQCFGTYQDPETHLPVLLMELMDESLTDYLKRSQDPIPFHTEVNFCYDIALGLSYLHSRGYVHRDLSSNNVLIMAGVRAKITDLGMCLAIGGSSFKQSHLTLCPGTQPYMPPEAFVESPTYTDKLDVFSFGVVMIQLMSHQYPKPGPAHRTLRTMLLLAIPEVERRENHIKLISGAHQMLPLAKECIQNSHESRPSSHDICNRVRSLRESHDYKDSKDQDNVQVKLERASELNESYCQMIKSLQQELSKIKIEQLKLQCSSAQNLLPAIALPKPAQGQISSHPPLISPNGFQQQRCTQLSLSNVQGGHRSPQYDDADHSINVAPPTICDHRNLVQESMNEHSTRTSPNLMQCNTTNTGSIPFDPSNLPEPAYDNDDLEMFHQEARNPLLQQHRDQQQLHDVIATHPNSKDQYSKVDMSMIDKLHARGVSSAGPNYSDYVAASPAQQSGAISFDPSNLPEPAYDTHDLEMFHREACSPEDLFTSGHMSMLIDPHDMQPIAKPQKIKGTSNTTKPGQELPSVTPSHATTSGENIMNAEITTCTSGLSEKLQEKLLTINKGAVTSHVSSMDSASSMPLSEIEHDNNTPHSEAHTSLESDSPPPSIEAHQCMGNRSDPLPSTSSNNASPACSGVKEFIESSITTSLGSSWVSIDIKNKEVELEEESITHTSTCISLDSQPRQRERAHAFSTKLDKSDKSTPGDSTATATKKKHDI